MYTHIYLYIYYSTCTHIPMCVYTHVYIYICHRAGSCYMNWPHGRWLKLEGTQRHIGNIIFRRGRYRQGL